MSTEPPVFKMDPTNCVVDITLYTGGDSDTIGVFTFSSLTQSLKLSKTLLDDIERKAVVKFVESLLVQQVLRNLDVTDEAYCAGLAESLGIERIIVRVKVTDEPPPPRGKGQPKQGKLREAMGHFAGSLEDSINAEARLKTVEAQLMEGFRGTTSAAFNDWAAKMGLQPEQAEEMRAIWKRANT